MLVHCWWPEVSGEQTKQVVYGETEEADVN